MKKLSNITESVWSDIHRRSNGEQTRKEDDVNLMDDDAFCSYLNSRYKVCDMNRTKSRMSITHTNTFSFINIPLFILDDGNMVDNSSFTYYPSEKAIGFGCSSKKYVRIYLDLLADKFETPESGITVNKKSQYLKGDITNKKVIDMIDFVLENIKKPLEPIIERI